MTIYYDCPPHCIIHNVCLRETAHLTHVEVFGLNNLGNDYLHR